LKKVIINDKNGMKLFKVSLFVIFILVSSFQIEAQDDWELKKDSDGIKVFTRQEEGSDIKAYRAEAVMEGKLSSFVAVLKDVASYGELYSSTKSAELLEEADTFLIEYTIIGLPWPVSDRDGYYINRFSQHYGTKIVTVNIESIYGDRPANEDYVRIRDARGFFKFLPIDGNRVEVIYQMKADPGGSLPAWVVNMFLVDGPFNDLKNLRERVKLAKYAGEKYDFLVDY